MRDNGLDFLKGFACILMVLSHAAIQTDSPIILTLGFLGSQAAVLFFAVSGATTRLTAHKYSLVQLFLSNLVFFILGLSLNGVIQGNYYQWFEIEMLQIIAVGSFLIAIVSRVRHTNTVVYLIIGLVIIGVHWIVDVVYSYPISNTFLAGWLFQPGMFTILPWLFVFAFGAFAYFAKSRTNLVLASISVAGLAITTLLMDRSAVISLEDKWRMTPFYFFLTCFVIFLSFYCIQKFSILTRSNNRLMLFLGNRSLIFLYIHIFVINGLVLLGVPNNSWFFWIVVIVVSVVLIKLLGFIKERINLESLFHNPVAWLILIFIILAAPLLTKNSISIFLIELVSGIIFSIYYPLLRKFFRSTQGEAKDND